MLFSVHSTHKTLLNTWRHHSTTWGHHNPITSNLPSSSVSSRERSTISELLREWGMLEEDLELSKLAADDIESRLESRFEKLSPESDAGGFSDQNHRIRYSQVNFQDFWEGFSEFLNSDSNFGIQIFHKLNLSNVGLNEGLHKWSGKQLLVLGNNARNDRIVTI